MSLATDHPEDLLQYLAATLEPGPAARVAEHLARCPECSLEAESLISMRQSLLRQYRSGHVPSEDLIAYEESAPEMERSRRESIRAHLQECAACRGDLQTLEAATRRLKVTRQRIVRWGAVAAAAAGAFLALWIVQSLRTQQAPVPDGRSSRSAIFAPARRGGEGVPRLSGAGPWAIKVLLPIDAPEGTYHCRFERMDGTPAGGPSALLASDGQGAINFSIDSLPSLGDYRLILIPESPAAGESYSYPFSVTPAPRSPDDLGP